MQVPHFPLPILVDVSESDIAACQILPKGVICEHTILLPLRQKSLEKI